MKKSNSTIELAKKEILSIPKPINKHLKKEESKDLPVYTEKKWVSNEEDLSEEMKKDKPRNAKVKTPEKGKTLNVTVTELPDDNEEEV
jgi:hypothetical protein